MHLKISGLSAEALYDTGSRWDKQDPMLQFSLGDPKNIKNTVRIKDAGIAGAWQETFEFDIHEAALEQPGGLWLIVTANNEGGFGGHTLIGTTRLDLKNIFDNKNKYNTAIKQTASLEHPKAKEAGKVNFTLQLDVVAAAKPVAPAKPAATGIAEEKAPAAALAQPAAAAAAGQKQLPDGPAAAKPGATPEAKSPSRTSGDTAASSKAAPLEPALPAEKELPAKNSPRSSPRNSTTTTSSAEPPQMQTQNKPSPRSKSPEAIANERNLALQDNEEWELVLDKLEVVDLTDTGGFMDKQDPCIKVWLNDVLVGKTKRIQDAGIHAKFEEVLVYRVPKALYTSASILKVEVYNESRSGGLTHVGVGTQSITDACPEYNIGVGGKISMALTHHVKGVVSSKSHEKGSASMRWQMTAKPKPMTEEPVKQESVSQLDMGSAGAGDTDSNDMIEGNSKKLSAFKDINKAKLVKAPFKQGRLNVTKIRLADLSHKSRDVFVLLELQNSTYTHETDPQAKSNNGICEYNFIDVSTDVERFNIHEGKVTLHLYECNKWNPLQPSRVHLGSADIALNSLLLNLFQEVHLQANIENEKLAKVGNLTIGLKLEQWNDMDETLALGNLGNGGMLEILSLRATDMFNVDAFLSKEVKRPFITFTYGPSALFTTDKEMYAKNGNVQFDNINFEFFDLTDSKLRDNEVRVDLYDRGVMSNSHLGSCNFKLDQARLSEETMIVENIVSKSGKVSGSLRVLFKVTDHLSNSQRKELNIQKLSGNAAEAAKAQKAKEEATAAAIASFSSGIFQIKSIDCKDLTNVEAGAFLGDQNDPYAVLSYGAWKQTTPVIDSGGSDVHWEDLYYSVDVTKEDLQKIPFLVEIWDKNSMSKDVQIGTHSFILSEYALEFDEDGDINTVDTNHGFKIKTAILDKRKNKVGTIILECMMKPSKEELVALQAVVDVAKSVEKGIIFISKMKAMGLRRDDNSTKASFVNKPYIAINYAGNTGVEVVTKEEPKPKGAFQCSTVGDGPNATWDAFSFQQRVTRKQLQQEGMFIYVKENKAKDAHNVEDDENICVGFIKNMLLAGSTPGKNIEVAVDMYAADVDFANLKNFKKRGEVILFLSFRDTTGEADAVKASPRLDDGIEKEGAAAFTEGYLIITYFQTKGLQTKGRPVVSFNIEGDPASKETLPVLTESGGSGKGGRAGDLHWDYNTRVHVTLDMLKSKSLELQVEDQHTLRGNTVVGTGHTDLSFFYKKSRINVPVDLSVDLHDAKGRPQGRVVIGCELRPGGEDPKVHEVPKEFKGAVLHFFKIQTQNLKNTEIMGLADPYIIIKDNTGHEIGRTYTAQDKGGSVLFDVLDIETSQTELFTIEMIKEQFVTVEAWDDNVGIDTLIGTGTVKLQDMLGPYKREVELPACHLTDNKGNLTGRVQLFAKLEEPLPSKDSPLIFPEKFTSGTAYIKKIVGFNIENKNWISSLNKADPYLDISVFADGNQIGASPIFSDKTAPIMDISGSHASWEFLDFEFKVNREILEKGTILITAKDKNFATSDVLIGSGTCSLRRTSQCLKTDAAGELLTEGETVELSIDLNLDAPGKPAKKGVSHGHLLMHIVIGKEQPKVADLVHKVGFEYGLMHISKIRTFDLKNTEMMARIMDARQDPYVKLKFGDWEDKTHPKDQAGSDAFWDFLVMECPIYLEDVVANKLEIQVYDKNNITADKLIGTGEASIVKSITEESMGKEVKLSFKIVDANGKPAGRVEIYVTTSEPKIGGEVPAAFDLGILSVSKAKIVGHNGSFHSPGLICRLGEQIEKTEHFLEKGVDPSYNMMWKAQCNKHEVHGKSNMVIDIMVKARITGSVSKVGSAKIELKPAGININKETQLSGVILDDKGMKLGRVVIWASLTADVVKSLPITDSLPKDFVTGSVVISKLTLASPQFSGKKIYARLEYAKWNECTSSQSAGKSTIYALNMAAEVSKDILKSDFLKVVVLEEGVFTHGVQELAYAIANSHISSKICNNFNRKIDIELDLLSMAKGSHGEVIGRAQLEVLLDDKDRSPDNDDGLPDSVITYKSAVLQIHKVSAFDLAGGDLIGKCDPYIKFLVENVDGEGNNWNAQTQNQKDAGRSAIWDSITDIAANVSDDTLRYKRLVVTAMDKNNFTKDAFMGVGEIGLRGAGAVPKEEKLLKISMKDKNGRAAGRVEVLVAIYPNVDMSDGQDLDGDGIDDGVQATKMNGVLHFNSASIVRQTGSKTDKLYIKFSVSGWKAQSSIETDRYGDQNWRWDPLEIHSKKLNTHQLQREGLTVQVYKMKGKAPSPAHDTMICELVNFSCAPALNQLGTFINVKGDAQHNGSFAGKFVLGMKYVPENEEAVTKQQEAAAKQGFVKPIGGDQAVPTKPEDSAEYKKLKHAHDEMADQMKGMETHLKHEMEQLIKSQTQELRRSMEQLERQQRKNVSIAPAPKKEKWDIFNVTNVELPANVNDWRVAHVQAWLAFQVELPAYMEAFQSASIDGLMLLQHIDETTLTSMLSVSNALHKVKLMNAIEELKERQEVINRKDDALRKARLKKAAADHEAEMQRIHDDEQKELKKLEKDAAKKKMAKDAKAHSHKSHKKSKGKKETFDEAGGKDVPSEQAQINRVKMERAAKLALAKKKALADKMNATSSTWKFEYTGTPKPTVMDIWTDENGDHPELGTLDYQNAMETFDILDDGVQQGTFKKMSTNNRVRHVKSVPKGSSVDEVLIAVKGSMFELSSRLLQVQNMLARRDDHIDDDLVSCDYSVEEVLDFGDLTELSIKDPVPTYDEVLHSAEPTGGDEALPEQEDEDWIAPPPIEAADDDEDYVNGYTAPPLEPTRPSMTKSPSKRITLVRRPKKMKVIPKGYDPDHHKDRSGLVYDALVNMTNNDAAFIGSNCKLTRLKLYGGCESLLRLRLTWSQFDSLWTRLDRMRSGDLDKGEFKAFFGDLSEFETKDGVQGLGTVGNIHDDMKNLTRVLYELCDVMRHAGFTVNEMFSSFDRDGGGNITVNEFCSMLRLILGPTFDRKLVYQSLLTLDTDRNKSISREEFFMFVYKTWRLQMEEIDYKKSCLDENKQTDAEKMHTLTQERLLIKSAVKKNFPRALRDVLEASSMQLSGPFATLFKDELKSNANATNTATESQSPTPASPARGVSRSLPVSPVSGARSGARPHSPSKVNNTGQIMRFKIRPPGASSPTRSGERLTLPHIKDMSKSIDGFTSSGALQNILSKTAPVGL